ncbi:ABC transporter permease [Chitinophagaceae bacterium LB-8]|uniref:ABC transporter permease n=1 Tax=Paraflavisolibacter caeni TaxID=2982496 RepID=A0A9X2XX69_9BACT|nr:ABC transporter permease [Paraflavisolibacter caeni]MCU7549363.1 ABC transporter permease [Paraflavisolibacter caeni]
MFRNYLKTALRNLIRNKLFTTVNVFGLATGMACSLLIFLWVQDELSFDRFNAKADKIYRITAKLADVEAAVVPPPLAAAIKAEIPGVENATRLSALHKIITVGTKKFDEKRIYYADSNFLKIFSYPLLKGNLTSVLTSPDAVVLTEATAIKYFGSAESAVGKIIYIDDDIKGRNLMVTGVLKNIPHNSHLQFDLLLPMEQYDRINNPEGSWNNFDAFVYFQLADNFSATATSIKKIEEQINELPAKNNKEVQANLSIQPLTDIHLHSHYMLDVEGQGNNEHVTIFSLIAIFILLIACINFINLSTALSAQRAKEVGLRKTIGALRSQLILQFLGESLLLSLISLIVATGLVLLLLPLFNDLSSKSLSINLLDGKIVGSFLGTAIVVGIISGSYPALFLSSFHPINVLKGLKIFEGKKSFLRSGLVILQFSISVILMISTIVVYRQLQFIKNRDIGFTKENLLYLKMPEVGDLHNNKEALKAILDQQPGISDYTITDELPTYLTSGSLLSWPTKATSDQVIAYRLRTDENFIKTFRMQLVAGRFFSKDLKTDDSTYVVNEATVRAMGLQPSTAIGKKLSISLEDKQGTIIGVVKDFNFKPVQQPVEPLVIKNNFAGGHVVLRTTPKNMHTIVAAIKNVFGKIYGDYPFFYGFVDEDLSKLYRAEQRMGKLFNAFSLLSIIISCLGLFGLAAFATQKRTKEIGVRKVLGASEAGIVALLSKDFIRLVALALIIAFPIAGWLMNKWLQGFTYRVSLTWWMYALAGLIALFVALITVSYQSIKAAIANPVKSLRTE